MAMAADDSKIPAQRATPVPPAVDVREVTPQPIPVSVIISVKNEEGAIVECIAGLREFAQVVVVDSASADRTQELARAAGADVVNFEWNGSYPKKKQWCLDTLRLRHDWVLFIDADERPSRQLVDEIRHIVANGRVIEYAAFDISLDYYFLGQRLKHGHRVVKRALMHRSRTQFPPLKDVEAPGMGEQEGHYQPVTSGRVGVLNGRIEHEDKDPFSTGAALSE